MRKRPLAAAAAVCVLAAAMLVFFAPDLFISEASYDPGDPVNITGKIYKIEEKTNSIYIFIGRSFFTRDNVLIAADKSSFSEDDFAVGDTITAQTEYAGFSSARNYGNFDEKSYYYSTGVFDKYYLSDFVITEHPRFNISEALRQVRKKIINVIYECAGEENSDTAGVIAAMITGDRTGIDEEITRLYRNAGISHIIAISGLHISFVGTMVYDLLRKRAGRKFSAAASVAVVAAFCIMTGLSVSSVRAFIMFAMRLAAGFAGRRFDILTSLSAAAILLLAGNPFYVTNSGFLLSFLAVLAIPLISESFQKFLAGDKRNRIISSFITSLSITIATCPVVISMYYEFPLYGAVINIIVIPLLSFLLTGVIFSSLAGLISVLAGRFLIATGIYLLSFIDRLCILFEKLPQGTLVTGHLSAGRIVLYYFVMVMSVVFCRAVSGRSGELCKEGKNERRRKYTSKRKAARISVFAVYILSLALILAYRGGSDDLQMIFADVDQGECTVMISPSGHTYMVDCGSTGVSDVYKYRVESALKYFGITKIDVLFITHPDSDHISGVFEMLENDTYDIEIGKIYTPAVEDNENYEKLLEDAAAAGLEVCALNSTFSLTDGDLTVKCLHPDGDYYSEDVNGYSAVLDVAFGEFSALLTGDLLTDGEELLVQKDIGQSDLLLVAHHGSKNSNSAEFLEMVSPSVSIISAGVDNSYGHPHAETLERLSAVGTQTFVTSDCGEIIVTAEKNGRMSVSYKIN